MEVNARGWDVGCEPLAMRKRDHPILSALPHGDRSPDEVEVESPTFAKREVVISPARDPGRDSSSE
jgi:hypothetical protein